jgi:hypothetical protein
MDLYHGCIVYDIVSSLPKTDKDHKKFMADWINLLHCGVDAASHSPQRICIVTDVSTPSLPLQSVAVFHLWHEGDLYDDWSAAHRSDSSTCSFWKHRYNPKWVHTKYTAQKVGDELL